MSGYPDAMDEVTALADEVRGWVDAAERVVVLAGAGISTDSGIPDFRGPNGVWTRNPGAEKRATLEHYMADPAVRRDSWRARLDHATWSAEPNAGHRALVALEVRGKLDTLVTQNIDGLHQAAGSDPAKVVEVHGTVRGRVHVLLRAVAHGPGARPGAGGEDDPDCRTCGGILKSATISFGQNLVPEDLTRAGEAARRCDLLLAVGSTLSVYPVADMVPVARMAGARVVIVNGSETAMDHFADAVLRGSISELLPRIVGT